MANKMVDIGTPDYGVWINADCTIGYIMSIRRGDMSDDASKTILMRSSLRVDGVALDSPLSPDEIIRRIKQAQAQAVPGVYED